MFCQCRLWTLYHVPTSKFTSLDTHHPHPHPYSLLHLQLYEYLSSVFHLHIQFLRFDMNQDELPMSLDVTRVPALFLFGHSNFEKRHYIQKDKLITFICENVESAQVNDACR